jgi:hypothetical protein
MPWTMFIEFFHLLLQIHHTCIFHFWLWLIPLDALNRILLSINISCHFLSLKCISRIHILAFIWWAHLLIELLFKHIEFVHWFLLSLSWRFWFQKSLLLLSMLYLSVINFEHLLVKLFFISIPFFITRCIMLSANWWVMSWRIIEALLFSLC